MSASKISQKLCIAASLAIVFSSGCHSSVNRVSPEGIGKCKDEIAVRTSSFSSTQERQFSFRQCLQSVDQRIQLERQSVQKKARETAEKQKALSNSVQEASANDMMRLCSSREEEIRSKVQSYNEVSGEISRINYSISQSDEVLSSLESKQRQIMGDLERLIPPSYRLGKPLMPDAAAILMRCDQQEIIALARK